jgi:hypothetical protein
VSQSKKTIIGVSQVLQGLDLCRKIVDETYNEVVLSVSTIQRVL